MSLIGVVARHELQALLKDLRLAGSIVVLLLILTPALLTLSRVQVKEFADYQESRQSLAGQVDHWQNLSRLPLEVYAPPPPLSFLSRGVLDQVARRQRFSRLDPPLLALEEGSESSWLPYFFRSWDVSSLCVVLFSVIPFVFGYTAFSREKELGTLPLLLSGSVSRATLLLGKSAGLALALLPAYLLALGLSLGTILLVPVIRIQMRAADWKAFALFALGLGLFALLMLQIAILVSTLTHRSSNTLLALLFFWLLALVVVPGLFFGMAEIFFPSPSSREAHLRERTLSAQIMQEYARVLEQSMGRKLKIPQRVFSNPGMKAVFINSKENRVLINREGMMAASHLNRETQTKLVDRLPELVRRQKRLADLKQSLRLNDLRHMMKQKRWVDWADYLSPPLCFQNLSAELAGTGSSSTFGSYRNLLAFRERFLRRVMDSEGFFSKAFFLTEQGGFDRSRLHPQEDSGLLPQSGPENPGLGKEISFRLGSLAGAFLLTFFAGFIASVGYDPR